MIPAAGIGSRIQPLAFSKELLPVGSRMDGATERPRAVSEYLIERMIRGGVDKICFVISPGKSDIIEYYGGRIDSADLCYVVQPTAAGLCDSIFRALPLISPHQQVVVGLPDTIWFPEDALCGLADDEFSLLLFPVEQPELFDAVITDDGGQVSEIRVKEPFAGSHWIWGALKMPGSVMADLHRLWRARQHADEYVGTLVNAYLAAGGKVRGVPAGTAYVDVGTWNGYRKALNLLAAARDACPAGY